MKWLPHRELNSIPLASLFIALCRPSALPIHRISLLAFQCKKICKTNVTQLKSERKNFSKMCVFDPEFRGNGICTGSTVCENKSDIQEQQPSLNEGRTGGISGTIHGRKK